MIIGKMVFKKLKPLSTILTEHQICVCVCVCARVCMCVKCVSLITASRGSWLKCEGAPSHSARH